MNKFICSNKGFTLIEVLLTIVIMTIISTILYSIFMTGLKLYQKIGVEGQLRDDADYIATLILNELYENTPNFIENYDNPTTGAKGIHLVRYQSKKVDRYIVEESNEIEAESFIYYESGKFYIERIINGGSNEKMEISSDTSQTASITNNGVVEASSISIGQCSSQDSNGKCSHGTISLDLVIKDLNNTSGSLIKTKPLVLKSTFGF